MEGALTPGEYEMAGNVSSQFISGLLFALPLLAGDSTLHLIPPVESRSYIDMPRAVQAAFGVESRWQDENTLAIPGGQTYHPCDYTVEGDYSQAAFPAVLGAACGVVTIAGLAPDLSLIHISSPPRSRSVPALRTPALHWTMPRSWLHR